jgi:DNA repair protein RadB
MLMISSGDRDFDEFLGNGFENNLISLIYGPSASGKTTLCLQTALNTAKKGRVLFVDSENGFSIDRLKQMNLDYAEYLDNIVVVKVKDFDEQIKVFENLDGMLKKGSFDIVIIDTIGMQYRRALQESNYSYVNERVLSGLRKLKHLAEDYNIPILITNQIYTNMKGENIGVGGRMMKGFGKYLIEFKKEPRRALMLKPSEKIFRFDIDNFGIKKII